MNLESIMACILAGSFAGFLNTLAGGGSLISLPLLIFLGLPPTVANGTNRLAILFQNFTAIVSFKKSGMSNFKLSTMLAIPAIIGALVGSKLAVDLPEEYFKKILSLIMLVVLGIILFSQNKEKNSDENIKKWPVIISFFFVGIYGGFIQAGVGFVIIAALSLTTPFDLIKCNVIKVFVVFFYTLIALGTFIYYDKINWSYGVALAIGNSLGAWAASRVAINKGNKVIKAILFITVTSSSIKLFFFS